MSVSDAGRVVTGAGGVAGVMAMRDNSNPGEAAAILTADIRPATTDGEEDAAMEAKAEAAVEATRRKRGRPFGSKNRKPGTRREWAMAITARLTPETWARMQSWMGERPYLSRTAALGMLLDAALDAAEAKR